MPANILKYQLSDRSLYQPVFVSYEFETTIVKTDEQSKLGELGRNRMKHIP